MPNLDGTSQPLPHEAAVDVLRPITRQTFFAKGTETVELQDAALSNAKRTGSCPGYGLRATVNPIMIVAVQQLILLLF